MFNIVRQTLGVLLKFRSALRYAPEQAPWAEADAQAWNGFLRTDAGQKLDVLMTHHVLDTMQDAVTKRGGEFEVGTANGVRQMWVYLKTLSANGAAPEDGSNQK